MKGFIVVLVSMFFQLGFSQNYKITSLKTENLKGKVKEVINGDFHYFFNKNGYLEKEIYSWSGKPSIIETYEFDKQTGLPKTQIQQTLKINFIKHNYHFTFKDSLLTEVIMEMDKKSDYEDKTILFEYDTNGRLIKKTTKQKRNRHNIVYIYSNTDTLFCDVYYKTKKINVLTDRKTYHNDLLIKHIKYTVDEEKNESDVLSIQIYEYNQMKDVISERLSYPGTDSSETTFIYTYKYDTKGNWISRKLLYNSNREEIVNRKIVYYDE